MRIQVPTMTVEEYIDQCFEDRLNSDAQVQIEYAVDTYHLLLQDIVSERRTLRLAEGSTQMAFADQTEGVVTLMRDYGSRIMVDRQTPWQVAIVYVKNHRFYTGWVLELRAGSFGPQTEGALIALEAEYDKFVKGAAVLSKKAGE